MRKIVFAFFVACALARPSAAQVTVGTGTSTNYVGPLGNDSQGTPLSAFAQTFVSPTGMNFLQQFTLYLSTELNGNQLFLQSSIYQFDGDRLTGPALFTSALFAGSGNAGDNDAFTFGSDGNLLNVQLAPNVVYAMVLSALPGSALSADPSTVQVNLGATDYANGELFYAVSTNPADLSAPGGFFELDGSTDAAFQASFSVTPTPEPASLLLVASGFAGMGGVVARRRRKPKAA
jgi:PEP-CTERM motif-containing protein